MRCDQRTGEKAVDIEDNTLRKRIKKPDRRRWRGVSYRQRCSLSPDEYVTDPGRPIFAFWVKQVVHSQHLSSSSPPQSFFISSFLHLHLVNFSLSHLHPLFFFVFCALPEFVVRLILQCRRFGCLLYSMPTADFQLLLQPLKVLSPGSLHRSG